MHGRTSMKLVTDTHCQVRMTLTTFEGHSFKGQGHGQLLWRRHTDRWFSVAHHLLCVPEKRPPFYFSNNFVKKLTNFNVFGNFVVLNPENI